MPWNTKHQEVLDAALAGNSAAEIGAVLEKLGAEDRQEVLCAVCSIHTEIACNSRQHGAEVAELIAQHCPLFFNGVATCLIEPREGW
ncbi:MAG TPA: hypothetical protein VKT49_07640 [Bryobacteraceae bacterium]|nr:hypothetical protein [Bryobacteraceae bacterium]